MLKTVARIQQQIGVNWKKSSYRNELEFFNLKLN